MYGSLTQPRSAPRQENKAGQKGEKDNARERAGQLCFDAAAKSFAACSCCSLTLWVALVSSLGQLLDKGVFQSFRVHGRRVVSSVRAAQTSRISRTSRGRQGPPWAPKTLQTPSDRLGPRSPTRSRYIAVGQHEWRWTNQPAALPAKKT